MPSANRCFCIALLLCLQPAVAEQLTWKEANSRSAEALKHGDQREGARMAKLAFERYPSESKHYTAENHVQLLLNLTGARASWREALRDLHDGERAVTAKAGSEHPSLLAIWREGIRIALANSEYHRAGRYYEYSVLLAERLWGSHDARVLILKVHRANDSRYQNGADWALQQLDEVDKALVDAPNESIAIAGALTRARIDVELKRPKDAVAGYRLVIERLEKQQDPDMPALLQSAYAQLEYACEQAQDPACIEDARRKLTATFGGVELVPLVRVQPLYPRRAARDRREGYVDIRVAIGADGLVRDMTVIASDPPGLFDEAALAALRQWKFKPRVVDGQPQPQQGMQKFRFLMEPG